MFWVFPARRLLRLTVGMAGISVTCLAMIMKGSLITLTFLCSVNVAAPSSQAGVPHAVCPNPTIKAVEGENIVLQCYLHPPTNVVNNAVDWKRVDLNKVVYSYRHKRENLQAQIDQYRGRAAVNHDGLTRGNLALQLSSVQLSDSGPYRCFVSKLTTSCNTVLTVVIKDQQNGTNGNVSSTTLTPLDEPNKPGGGTWMPFIIAAIVLVIITATGVLMWKCGGIHKCVMCLRGWKKRKGESGNGTELQHLGAQQSTNHVKDQDGPAANSLQNNMQVVP